VQLLKITKDNESKTETNTYVETVFIDYTIDENAVEEGFNTSRVLKYSQIDKYPLGSEFYYNVSMPHIDMKESLLAYGLRTSALIRRGAS